MVSEEMRVISSNATAFAISQLENVISIAVVILIVQLIRWELTKALIAVKLMRSSVFTFTPITVNFIIISCHCGSELQFVISPNSRFFDWSFVVFLQVDRFMSLGICDTETYSPSSVQLCYSSVQLSKINPRTPLGTSSLTARSAVGDALCVVKQNNVVEVSKYSWQISARLPLRSISRQRLRHMIIYNKILLISYPVYGHTLQLLIRHIITCSLAIFFFDK